MIEPVTGVAWLDWSDEAFARARRERKPVLLFLAAPWCQWCDTMDRTSFADPIVARLVHERYVPLRVDVERRPDLGDRYGLGGWPTVVFLTASGEILTGGTFVAADRLREMLPRIADTYLTRLDTLEERPASPSILRTAPVIDDDAPDWAARRLADEFDETYGGFGDAPKMPHTEALLFAIARARQNDDESFRLMVHASLDAMDEGLLDGVDGGCFRCCAGRDWTRPGTEKLLEANAALLQVYVSAWRVWSREHDRRAAVSVLRYVGSTLADRTDGGFYGSQRASDTYFGLASRDERLAHGPPPVDETLFTRANATMIRTFLDASDAFGDEALGEFAIRSLERVLLATYHRGSGVAHWTDEDAETGLLGDQIGMAAALVDAFAATDRPAYLDLAQELILTAMRQLSDEQGTAFLDRAPSSTGRLREPIRPLGLNCEAAMVLTRLTALTGEAAFRNRAAAVLAAFGESYRAHGLQGVCYARAVQTLRSEPAGPEVKTS